LIIKMVEIRQLLISAGFRLPIANDPMFGSVKHKSMRFAQDEQWTSQRYWPGHSLDPTGPGRRLIARTDQS